MENWENQVSLLADGNLQAKKTKVMRRQTTFVFHQTSHPWSRGRVLIWMLATLGLCHNFHIPKCLHIYFWLSFIPAILVMLVGTKLQHVVSSLALEIVEPTGPPVGTQNAFEMATFIWSLWGLERRSCIMHNDLMIIARLASGYTTVPLNVIVTQPDAALQTSNLPKDEYPSRVEEYLSETLTINASQPSSNGDEDREDDGEEQKVKTL
ncbi:hypothetical protein FNV43_RR14152 [Rhamnella rubrinervis]|uniref:Uncharacterized protein n=1 Tax=Rhamnella rubrinervis TaxID=2594499 RepID=A0A8K0H2G9_9ROSA|nr:hypothetical protein FNV43_RR14152 [Rhamnella rubrinervis]